MILRKRVNFSTFNFQLSTFITIFAVAFRNMKAIGV